MSIRIVNHKHLTLRDVVAKHSIPAAPVGSAINRGRLENLKVRIDGIDTSLKDGNSGLESAIHSNLGSHLGVVRAGSLLSQIRGSQSTRSHNPLDNQGSGLKTDRNNQTSDGVSDAAGTVASAAGTAVVAAEMGQLPLTAIFGGGGAGTAAVGTAVGGGAAAFGVGYAIGTAANAVGLGGWIAGALGELYGDAVFALTDSAQPGQSKQDQRGEPTPDNGTTSNGPKFITGADLKGLAARKGAKGEPVDDSGSTGGPVDPNATSEGKRNTMADYGPDGPPVSNITLTARNLDAIAIRFSSRVTNLR
jgi:hypothetical protein